MINSGELLKDSRIVIYRQVSRSQTRITLRCARSRSKISGSQLDHLGLRAAATLAASASTSAAAPTAKSGAWLPLAAKSAERP